MTPEASIASLFLIGSTGGGLVCSLSCGRSILTAWVWIGMVMINMMSRTSMTSIHGVVFISIIGSLSSRPPLLVTYYTTKIFRDAYSPGLVQVQKQTQTWRSMRLALYRPNVRKSHVAGKRM